MEKWKLIKGFDSLYEVSSSGRVRSLTHKVKKWNGERTVKGKEKTPATLESGYLYVDLYKDGRRTRFTVHRLVALAFIPEVKGKPFVNHIDGDKRNNAVSNLEWVTNQENQILAVLTGQSKNVGDTAYKATPVVQLRNGKIVNRWGCMTNAAKSLGINIFNISACCAGRRKTAGGYEWRYQDER